MRKKEMALSMITHLGPMTEGDIWDAIWGPREHNRKWSMRVLGFFPSNLDYDLKRLEEDGCIHRIGRRGRSIIWEASDA